jgi:hypothetical protein
MCCAADARGGDLGLLGDDAGGELLRRHFQREESDDAAGHGLDRAVRARLAFVVLRDLVGDVGRERGLAHGRAARDDDEIRALQAAHQVVEIGKAGRDARESALALVGLAREIDRVLQRLGETHEAAVVAADFGDFVEAPLGVVDLVLRGELDRGVIGDVDHVLADLDQVAAGGKIVDRAAVVFRVDDGGGFRRQPREVLRRVQPCDVGFRRNEGFQRDGRSDLAGADQAARDLENLLMDRLEEVFRLEEVGNAVERLVIHEDRAEQCLLDLNVMRRLPEIRGFRFRKGSAECVIECHRLAFSSGVFGSSKTRHARKIGLTRARAVAREIPNLTAIHKGLN